jgi:splicing factor 3B subunit 3
MRAEHPPLAGRDHLAFRSAYFPVREVVDGDLCTQFAALPPAKQQAIAAELDRSPGEVLKKLEDVRNKLL